jgi:hypothetical protein
VPGLSHLSKKLLLQSSESCVTLSLNHATSDRISELGSENTNQESEHNHMAEYSKLSAQEINDLDSLIEKLQAEPNWIKAVANFVVKAAPVVVAVAQAIGSRATPGAAAAQNLLSGKMSAKDLIALRKAGTD